MRSITHYIKESASKFLVNKKAVKKHDDAMYKFDPLEIYHAVLFLTDNSNARYSLIITGVEVDAEEQTIGFIIDESTSQWADVRRSMQRDDRYPKLNIFYEGIDHCIQFNDIQKKENGWNEFVYEYESSQKIR